MNNGRGMYGLPIDVKFCKRCVISNQRPSSTIEFLSDIDTKKETIEFDEDGVCSACRHHEDKHFNIDWEQREKDLLVLLDKYRSNNEKYDVIVPGSGGKDSGFASHILKYKYGMNPLTVTWSPHLYTDIGWKNFQNWIHVGGLDNFLYTPNGRLHSHLTKLAFLNLLHPFQPFIVGQKIVGPLMAYRFDVKLIMYGENQVEGGNNILEAKNSNMKDEFYSIEDIEKIKLGGLSIKQIINDSDFTIKDFAPYIPLSPKDVSRKNVRVEYLGHYFKWDPQECFYYSVDNTGFTPNTERTEGSYAKYSSIDDKIDPQHYYTTLVKFGLGRTSYDAAQEIRNFKITREEGVQLVHKYDQEFPKKYFKEFLEYINITEDEYWETINRFRTKHLWEKVDGNWRLKYIVE